MRRRVERRRGGRKRGGEEGSEEARSRDAARRGAAAESRSLGRRVVRVSELAKRRNAMTQDRAALAVPDMCLVLEHGGEAG
eukprot:2328522-Rhodomonas_salina.1